jgi:two-component sensor histidine kinase
MLNLVHAETTDAVILAPVGRDADVARRMLEGAGMSARVCDSLAHALDCMDKGHCLVATEEALLANDRADFAAWMRAQEPWSDYPVILLASKGGEVDPRLAFLEGWMLCLERPFRPTTLIQAVRSGVRARRRQLEVKAAMDERARTAERQRLLIRELHHRVKNTLANVQALLGATARSSDTIEAFQKAFAARIVSLAETHTMLTDDYWQMAPLRRMLERELRPFIETQDRLRLKGPDVDLVADLAVPIGMAFHELTTNSAKYGALSAPFGKLWIDWSVRHGAGQRELHFAWREEGGPPVSPPTRKGFGTVLVEHVLAVQLNAVVVQDFAREGFRFELTMPLRADRIVPNYQP